MSGIVRKLCLVLMLCLTSSSWAIQIDTELMVKTDGVQPGATQFVALEVVLPHGYHVNANKPFENYLIPTVMTIEVPEGIALGEVVYPAHKEVVTGGSLTAQAVYGEVFVIAGALLVDEAVSVGEYPITVKLRYQACNDTTCLQPATLSVEGVLKVTAVTGAANAEHAASFDALKFNDSPEMTPVEGAPNPEPTAVSPTPAAEADTMLLLEKFEVLGVAEGFMKPEEFAQFIRDAQAGVVRKSPLEGKGPIAIMLLVLLGGLFLNLTPCVFPLIPVNLAIIGAGVKAGSKARGFVLGGAYGLAMAVVYGGLGLIVILTAGSFGTINASPWFNVAIAVLFIVLGLAMFDIISIDFSKYQTKFNLTKSGKKGSLLLAFGMGGISALLAGACVAPIVIQVIVFSSDLYAKGSAIALALPFLLGLGMAIPWPLAGAGMGILPKPGAWMVRVKQGMGVFIIAFAVYYGYLAYGLFDSRNVDKAEVTSSAQAMLEHGWTSSMSVGLEQARDEDKLVLVDMWATWCKNCLVMDKKTLNSPEVDAVLEDFVKIKYQSEDLTTYPAKDVLNYFNGYGLPTYAVLRQKDTEASTR